MNPDSDPIVYLYCSGDAEGPGPAPLSEYLEGRTDLPPFDVILDSVRRTGRWSNGHAVVVLAS